MGEKWEIWGKLGKLLSCILSPTDVCFSVFDESRTGLGTCDSSFLRIGINMFHATQHKSLHRHTVLSAALSEP